MICRLCLEIASQNLEIFSKNPEPKIAEIIAKYFLIEVRPNDLVSTIICTECWQHLIDFHRFWSSIDEKQKTLQTHLVCKEIKQDIEEFEVEDDAANATSTSSPIDHKSNELLEPEIDLIVEQPHSFAEGPDFEAVDVKDDDMSMDRDSLLVPFTSSPGSHAAEENVLELNTTAKNKNNKRTAKLAKTATKKILKPNLRSATKKGQIDCDGEISEESAKTDKAKESSKNKVKPEYAKTSLIRELDQYLAENTQLSCCLCSQPLTDFKDLKKHFRLAHNTVGYIPCCNNRFNKRTAYVDHLKLHKDPDYFKCKICNKQLASRHNYQNHMYTVHPDGDKLLFPCKLCSRKFAKQYILDYHIKSKHTTTKDFICETCNKGFKTPALLKQHEKAMHLNTYDSVCDICGKCFKTAQNLATHVDSFHDANRTGVQCKICYKRLKNSRCLNKHMISHRDQESGEEFNCVHCGKVKSTRHALASHIAYHHSDKVFTCKMCGKDFKHPRALREHESTHTGTYLYNCPFCPKAFRSHGNMHKHKTTNHALEYESSRSKPGDATQNGENNLQHSMVEQN